MHLNYSYIHLNIFPLLIIFVKGPFFIFQCNFFRVLWCVTFAKTINTTKIIFCTRCLVYLRQKLSYSLVVQLLYFLSWSRVLFLLRLNFFANYFTSCYIFQVNNNPDLLPDVTLVLKWVDTRGDTVLTTRAITEMLCEGVTAFFGPEGSCYVEAIVAQSRNVPMISYVSSLFLFFFYTDLILVEIISYVCFRFRLEA